MCVCVRVCVGGFVGAFVLVRVRVCMCVGACLRAVLACVFVFLLFFGGRGVCLLCFLLYLERMYFFTYCCCYCIIRTDIISFISHKNTYTYICRTFDIFIFFITLEEICIENVREVGEIGSFCCFSFFWGSYQINIYICINIR
jgi:hypothetical protein